MHVVMYSDNTCLCIGVTPVYRHKYSYKFSTETRWNELVTYAVFNLKKNLNLFEI